MLIIYSLFFSVLENLRVDARITAAPNATPTATQTGSLVATAIDVPTATPIAIHPPFLFFPNIAFLLYYSHSIVTSKWLSNKLSKINTLWLFFSFVNLLCNICVTKYSIFCLLLLKILFNINKLPFSCYTVCK